MVKRVRFYKLATAAFFSILTAPVVLMLLVSMATTASAQLSGKGAVSGRVADSTGAAIPAANVVLTNDATKVSVTTTSTSAGDFSVSTLDPGVYTIVTSAPGFGTLTQQNVQVNALETQTYNPSLSVGGSNESVTVSSLPPQLETTNATLGATMENEMYSALPIEMGAYGQPDQRRATDFVFLMPGVQGNNTNGNATTNTGIVNGSGSRGGVSAVYIDGLPFVRAGGQGDPRFVWTAISVDAVDQFQVQTSGYSAIYEGQGIQNYTIKQGGPKYHGSVYEFFRNTALDTYGFFGKLPNPATGLVHKPVEHTNEYGINLSGPLVPFGSLRDKLFFFGNYNGFRFASETPTLQTFPTAAEQRGDFSALGVAIYDPTTQAACTANSTTGPCRYQYGYTYAGTPGPAGNPKLTGASNVIPSSQFSAVALKLQSYLPALSNQSISNNYVSANRTGLTNFSTTERIDYVVSPKNTVTLVAAVGRQASSVPVGQTTAGRNVGPVPYNFGQAYAPKTVVAVIEDTHTFSPHVVNQLKYGYARYNGPTFDADQLPPYAATAQGLTGLPAGAASTAFPIVTFSGTNAPTNWGGAGPNITLAENYSLVDNVQWVKGKHTLTMGAQVAWLLYNVINATGGSTPLTLANTATTTAGIDPKTNTLLPNTGLAYAGFLIGQIGTGSFTSYIQQEFGTRFRAISPYVQDNWKVTPKLTLDFGLRYDYFPTLREVHNAMSFFSPTTPNPVTGQNGALLFTGRGNGTCNCDTPVHNYYKNFGPRLGLAYQVDPKTVIRASYGVMFTHGNAVGGSATTLGTLGFSASPSFGTLGNFQSSFPLAGSNGAIPTYTLANGVASGPQYGTGNTNIPATATSPSYTGTALGVGYPDPYLGSRAPEYINYTFGFQHQWTDSFTSTISYVGSQGHFLPADGTNARGYYADQLDPKYLALNTNLALSGTKLSAYCSANAGVCPSSLSVLNATQQLSSLLRPFPFQTVSDTFGYVANSNYHSLQTSFNMRATHGLTFMANYTWSRAIDDGGTFRSGYAIPASFSNTGRAYKQDAIERTVSTSNQPHHVVLTGVWALPLGKEILAGNRYERAILGGFKLSEIFQAYSGSPLAITASSCQTNPAQATCEPTINASFYGRGRINGKWGAGYLAGQSVGRAPKYLNESAFVPLSQLNTALAPAYTFGNSPRTAPFGMTGPGNYNLDLALVRTFPLHITESSRFNFRAEWYNVTNHTLFGVANTVFGNSNFGQVTNNTSATRKSVQLSARIEF